MIRIQLQEDCEVAGFGAGGELGVFGGAGFVEEELGLTQRGAEER